MASKTVTRGVYHLTEKSGWGVESIMVSDSVAICQFTVEIPHPLPFESEKGRICVAWVWNREGTEKLVNGKQHSVWFVATGMRGLPRLEFPRSDLTIYLPSGISDIFRQMVSNQGLYFVPSIKTLTWVFSWGDFFLESLLCAQRLWILNLFWADTELWAPRFDWLKDYNFWTFQM